jgi:hypothetical protein
MDYFEDAFGYDLALQGASPDALSTTMADRIKEYAPSRKWVVQGEELLARHAASIQRNVVASDVKILVLSVNHRLGPLARNFSLRPPRMGLADPRQICFSHV